MESSIEFFSSRSDFSSMTNNDFSSKNFAEDETETALCKLT